MKLSERAAVTPLFFLNGVIFSSFFARLPAIKADLGASDGELGMALFFATAGLVVAQPLAGRWPRARARARRAWAAWRSTRWGCRWPPPRRRWRRWPWCCSRMGLANGVLDVAMNVEGVAVERRRGRRVLSSMHAAFSFGGMTGAGLGGLAAAAGLDAEAHLAVVAALVLAGGAGGRHRAAGAAPGQRRRAVAFARPDRRLALLGAVAFCVLLAEGSVTDWSAVFLNEGAGASRGPGRGRPCGVLAGDGAGPAGGRRLAERFGAPMVIRAGALLAAAGLGLALATAEPAAGIAGYALMGVGPVGLLPAGRGRRGARLG